jgi:hypothetical protein
MPLTGTVSGIGAAIYCLARLPAQFARLRADPSLARAAGGTLTNTTLRAAPPGMSAVAAASINASASCWRGWKANASSWRSPARLRHPIRQRSEGRVLR